MPSRKVVYIECTVLDIDGKVGVFVGVFEVSVVLIFIVVRVVVPEKQRQRSRHGFAVEKSLAKAAFLVVSVLKSSTGT